MKSYEDTYSKFIEELFKKIDKLKDRQSEYQTQYNNLYKMNEFVNNYKMGIFDENLLAIFFEKLHLKYTISDIKNAHSFITTIKNNESLSKQFSFQIEKCETILKECMTSINSLMPLYKIGNLSYNISYIEKEIIDLKKILDAMDSNGFLRLFDEEMTKNFFEVLQNCNLDSSEKCFLAFQLTKMNAKEMQKYANKEKLKESIKKNKAINTKEKKIKTAEKIKAVEENKDSYQKEEKLLESLNKDDNNLVYNDEQKELLEKAYQILEQEKDNNISNDIIEIVSLELQITTPISKRNTLYSSSSNFTVKKKIICDDIKNNVLKEIVQNKNMDIFMFDILKNCIQQYYKVLEQEKEKEVENNNKDAITILQEMNDEKTLEFVNNIIHYMDYLNKLLTENHKTPIKRETYISLFEGLEKLKNYYETYENALICYINNPSDEEIKEIMELCYNDLENMYNNLKLLGDSMYSSPNEELLTKAMDVYNKAGNVNNIILFVDENLESNQSVIESDIFDSERLLESDHKQIIETLKSEISNNFMEVNDKPNDHKIKDTYVSEEFLKKYRPKSTKCGHARIFYSRYNTNLSKVYSELKTNPYVYVIYKIDYGNMDNRKKVTLYYDAIARCKKNVEHIDYIREIILTDWEKLAPEEKAIKKQELDNYLRSQTIKFGHLINSYDMKKEKEGESYGSA